MVVLGGGLFLMGEVPLYPPPSILQLVSANLQGYLDHVASQNGWKFSRSRIKR